MAVHPDREWFAEAYEVHRRRVVTAAQRVLKDTARAEDVAQEVFERLWRSPGRFDPRRGELGPYLQLVARSRALDAWRSEGAATRAADRLGALSVRDAPAEHEQPGPEAEHRAEHELLVTALRRLPLPQREAILLAYWGGMSSSEIARSTGVPLGTAKSRLRLAHAKLRDELTSMGGAPEPGVAAA